MPGNYSTDAGGGTDSPTIPANSAASWSVGFAPAVEYNWDSRMGIIVGLRSIPIGNNTGASITPVAAVNRVSWPEAGLGCHGAELRL
jgi:hypothetical protein